MSKYLFGRGTRTLAVAFAFLLAIHLGSYDVRSQRGPVTRQEMLRGTITPEREWWDVLHYDLSVRFYPETRTISGSDLITFKTLKPGRKMQIDLQPPLAVTKVTHGAGELTFEREGNVYWVTLDKEIPAGVEDKVEVFYEGKPAESKNPPWSGGVTWTHDELGKPFIATTCQGIGASIWWPNKDHLSDEPDRGVRINITVPDDLTAVSNGRLKGTDADPANHTKTFHWEVVNPINNYGVNVNIGNYVNFSEKYRGEGGDLDMSYWVLAQQKDEAEKQFKEAPRVIEAFEHWFGKYPFYEDSYKLVSVPYLGMEHQSSVTYGNRFHNGYLGTDLSGTGVGLKFDYIIVHESGHEWFGNNISMKDGADMWIHEGFTTYSECLFVEYWFGKKDAQDYVIGERRKIRNDEPIIGTYGANREGSGDMYFKGASMLHTIRQVVNNDEKWRSILRGLNQEFWHQTVTTRQVESYMSGHAGVDLSKVFDQYLRSTKVPVLSYKIAGKRLTFKYDDVVSGFAMPVRVVVNGKPALITPGETARTKAFPGAIRTFEVDRNYYVTAKKMD